MEATRNLLKRRWRLIAFVVGIALVFALCYALRSAILPFLVGAALAYLLMPVVLWLERKLPYRGRWRGTKRVFSIILVFIVILALVGFFAYYIVVAVVDAFLLLVNNAPQYFVAGFGTLQEWTEGLRQYFPPEMQQQVDELILNASTAVGNALQEVFTRGISVIPSTFSMILGFASLPVFLFFILKDSERLHQSFYSSLPPWLAEHTRNVIAIIEGVLGRYIRAQLMLGLVVTYLCFIGLLIMQIPFAGILAVVAGITELIPMIGPWIGGAIAVIITLALVPEKVIWVILLFLGVQLLENNLLVPRIHGGYLHIHPAVLIVLLVLGVYIAGFWGILLVAPLTATVVQIYKYVRNVAREEGNQ